MGRPRQLTRNGVFGERERVLGLVAAKPLHSVVREVLERGILVKILAENTRHSETGVLTRSHASSRKLFSSLGETLAKTLWMTDSGNGGQGKFEAK